MIDQITVIYCTCDELVKCFGIQDDIQCKMCTAEIMTFALTSALICGCDYKRTRLISLHLRFFPKILSHSQIVRRIHKIPQCLWYMVFYALRHLLRDPKNLSFIIDSFPVKTYETHKSFRAKLFSGKQYHGYTASKKQYFFGIKVHMIIDNQGIPIEFVMTPGCCSDIKALDIMDLNLPEGSIVLGDKAYTSYQLEDYLLHFRKIKLVSKRRKNLKRQHSKELNDQLRSERNRIETVFSSIVSRLPRYIRARTETGFCLKILFIILAYMINLICD